MNTHCATCHSPEVKPGHWFCSGPCAEVAAQALELLTAVRKPDDFNSRRLSICQQAAKLQLITIEKGA